MNVALDAANMSKHDSKSEEKTRNKKNMKYIP